MRANEAATPATVMGIVSRPGGNAEGDGVWLGEAPELRVAVELDVRVAVAVALGVAAALGGTEKRGDCGRCEGKPVSEAEDDTDVDADSDGDTSAELDDEGVSVRVPVARPVEVPEAVELGDTLLALEPVATLDDDALSVAGALGTGEALCESE